MKKPLDPKKMQDACQAFIVKYITTIPIDMPDGMSEEDYSQAMTALTKAMTVAWGDGFLCGSGK